MAALLVPTSVCSRHLDKHVYRHVYGHLSKSAGLELAASVKLSDKRCAESTFLWRRPSCWHQAVTTTSPFLISRNVACLCALRRTCADATKRASMTTCGAAKKKKGACHVGREEQLVVLITAGTELCLQSGVAFVVGIAATLLLRSMPSLSCPFESGLMVHFHAGAGLVWTDTLMCLCVRAHFSA